METTKNARGQLQAIKNKAQHPVNLCTFSLHTIRVSRWVEFTVSLHARTYQCILITFKNKTFQQLLLFCIDTLWIEWHTDMAIHVTSVPCDIRQSVIWTNRNSTLKYNPADTSRIPDSKTNIPIYSFKYLPNKDLRATIR